MSLKNNRFFARNICAAFLFTGISFIACSLWAQVPNNTPGKDIKVAFANETAGSAGTMESLRSYSTRVTVEKIVANAPIPFGKSSHIMLDMKGYDQQFTRSFTFTNSSSSAYTINSVGFEDKNSKFDFISIGSSSGDSSFPIDIAPGETFTVRVTFISPERNKSCSDHLVFTVEQSKEPIVYPIRALQQPLSQMPWNKKEIASSAK